MPARPPWRHDDVDDEARKTASLVGLAVTLALLIAGLVLVRALHVHAAIEDCLLAGRIACDVSLVP